LLLVCDPTGEGWRVPAYRSAAGEGGFAGGKPGRAADSGAGRTRGWLLAAGRAVARQPVVGAVPTSGSFHDPTWARKEDCSYPLYANSDSRAGAFEGRLRFTTTMVPHDGNDAWVLDESRRAVAVVEGPDVPPAGEDCAYRAYVGPVATIRG
jgi:hypothetical protein